MNDNNVYYANLPNKNGNYVKTKIPQYVVDILKNVTLLYDYTLKLTGINPQRPAYGIEKDIEALKKWAKRYHTDFSVKSINKCPKNYYVLFEMFDPVVYQLEKIGLL